MHSVDSLSRHCSKRRELAEVKITETACEEIRINSRCKQVHRDREDLPGE